MVIPLVEAAAFAAACWTFHEAPLAAAAWLALAALALNFSVHIAFHECVHHGRSWAMAGLSAPITLLIGMPFDGYRLHHHNHHRAGNGLDDYSCTWRATASGPRRRHPLAYALGWPIQLAQAMRAIRRDARAGEVAVSTRRLIAAQKLMLVATLVALAAVAPAILAMYLALIYVGWALVSAHNYGQHPPPTSAATAAAASATEASLHTAPQATSYPNRIYNRMLANNGLHWEHHQAPEIPWHALAPAAQAPRARRPHVLNVA